MSDQKTKVQADGDGKHADTIQGHEPGGGGESGGGAYKTEDFQDGDNRERVRPVETGREPK